MNHPGHTQVAADLAGIADAHLARGRSAEAEGPLRRALEIWEDELGTTTHPLLCTPVNKFALLLRNVGKLRESEAYYRRAMARGKSRDLRKNTLPPHTQPAALRTINGQARPQGKGAKRETGMGRAFGATVRALAKFKGKGTPAARARPPGAMTIIANKRQNKGITVGGRVFAGAYINSYGAHSGENFA